MKKFIQNLTTFGEKTEFLRIIDELRQQEEKEDKRQDQDLRMIVSAMRLHAEAQHELTKQIIRLNRTTTLLALTQIFLVTLSIIIAVLLSTR